MSAVATVISTIGVVQAYVWGTPPPAGGGSPHSGPVGSYIWSNPNQGIANPRSITNPVPDEQPTNNSWVLQSPTNNTTPVGWNTLNSSGGIVGSIPLFDPALESEGFQTSTYAWLGVFLFPQREPMILPFSTKTRFSLRLGEGLPSPCRVALRLREFRLLMGRQLASLPGCLFSFQAWLWGRPTNPAQTTNLAITFPGAGIYQVEVDWDYWDKHQATFIMQCASSSPNSPTIPPLPLGVRSGVVYWGKYRSTATGAQSNPSPASEPQVTPVLDNTVSLAYSSDPQVDKVDFYGQDEGLPNPTYVATGPTPIRRRRL